MELGEADRAVFARGAGERAGLGAVARHGGEEFAALMIGISREQWPLAMAALSLGGDVRVGLEDNFYLPNGEMAKSNGDPKAARRHFQNAVDLDAQHVDAQRELRMLNKG